MRVRPDVGQVHESLGLRKRRLGLEGRGPAAPRASAVAQQLKRRRVALGGFPNRDVGAVKRLRRAPRVVLLGLGRARPAGASRARSVRRDRPRSRGSRGEERPAQVSDLLRLGRRRSEQLPEPPLAEGSEVKSDRRGRAPEDPREVAAEVRAVSQRRCPAVPEVIDQSLRVGLLLLGPLSPRAAAGAGVARDDDRGRCRLPLPRCACHGRADLALRRHPSTPRDETAISLVFREPFCYCVLLWSNWRLRPRKESNALQSRPISCRQHVNA